MRISYLLIHKNDVNYQDRCKSWQKKPSEKFQEPKIPLKKLIRVHLQIVRLEFYVLALVVKVGVIMMLLDVSVLVNQKLDVHAPLVVLVDIADIFIPS